MAAPVLSAQGKERIERAAAKYPPERRQSAVMAALAIAQDEHGWLPSEVMEEVARVLGMPAASCTVSLRFNPTAAGVVTGQLTVSGSGGSIVGSMTGTATLNSLTISPMALTFPTTPVGSVSAPQSFIVTNNGTAPSGALTTSISGLRHSENALHLDAIWMLSLTEGFDLGLLAGPSIFFVKQDTLGSLTVVEPVMI